MSDHYTYSDYVINDDPYPLISGSYDKTYWLHTSSYTFFSRSVSEQPEVPMVLRPFYTRASSVGLVFSWQPEHESTDIFENAANSYRSETLKDERMRSAGIHIEYMLRRHTGLLLALRSSKEEKFLKSSNSLDSLASGETNEIRRYYSLGFSRYLRDNLKCTARYTFFDGEYIGLERRWTEGSSLLFSDYGREAESDGHRIQATGEYIINNRFGLYAFYEALNKDSHSHSLSSYYDNFPGPDSYFDDEALSQEFGMALRFYANLNTTLELEGRYLYQTLDRTYNTDQGVEYEWNIGTAAFEALHYVTPHVGMRVGYAYTRRDIAVLIWHPETEGNPQSTWNGDADVHAFYIGLHGRF